MKISLSLPGLLFVLIACSQPVDPLAQEIFAVENGLTKAFVNIDEPIKSFSIKERMEYYSIPGLSMAVVIDGKLRWAKGYGFANTETGTKVDSNTLFQAASISKPIGALAILKLAEDQKIHLDSNVNKYLSSWKLDENGLTTEHVPSPRLILSHNAGISVHGFEGYTSNETIPTIDQVLNGEGNSPRIMVDTEPGIHTRYSGGGYTVLQKLIEDYAGEAYETYLQRTILEPLGMLNSTFHQPLPRDYQLIASAAYDGEGKIIDGFWHHYPEKAAAGLWTTPTDLAKYLIEIMEIRNGKDNGILSKDMARQMLTDHGGYRGLGPEVTDSDGTLEFGHLGKNAGFTNDMLAGADTKNGIIIMTNADNGGKIMSEIQRSVCSYYDIDLEIPDTQVVEKSVVPIKDLARLTGRYEFVVPDTGERLNQFMDLRIHKGKLSLLDVSSGDVHTLETLLNHKFLDFGSGLLINFNLPDSVRGFIIEDWEAKLIRVD